MKQGKVIGIIFAVVNILLVILCAVLFFRADRKEPEITFHASDVIYTEGSDPAELLSGAVAYDGADGEITDRIVIEKIVEDRERKQAVVYYAVSDYSGNVAKASRVFDAVYMEEESERFPEAGFDAEIKLSHSIQQMETDAGDEGEPSELEEQKEAGEQESEEPVPEETPEKTMEPEEEAAPTPERTPEPAPTPEPVKTPVPTADPSVPVLTLKVTEVKVKAGQGPAWVDLIGVLSDDKDTYETLFHNLSVSKYDKEKPGRYSVSVLTEDSDGNRSQSVPLTIIVQ